MSRTPEEQSKWEQQCYGCAIADFKGSVEKWIDLSGPAMIVTSMLSDAQEEMAHGLHEEARQTLNRAKWMIREYLMPKGEEV